jgi:tyrosine-protein kinase Etk/Wzc
VLGTAYAFLAQPVYRANVIQVEDKANNNNGKDTLQPLSGMFDTKPTTSAEIELLRSRLVTEETVKKLHLDIAAQPHYLPVIGGLVGDLVNGKWGFSLPPFIDLLVKTIMDIAHVGAIGDGVVAVIPVERFFRVRSQAQAIP